MPQFNNKQPNSKENCIEWLSGQDTITCTLSQKKFINRVRKLSQKHESIRILYENPDGSILAKLPISAIHFNIHTYNGGGFLKNQNEQEGESDE